MTRLFVAIDFPPHIQEDLLNLRPPPGPGIRRVEADQMHLTLHFLGPSDLERTAEALKSVNFSPFALDLAGVGQFDTPDGSVVLWAGIQPSPHLTALHAAVAEALAPLGFRPEARPYSPHLTLARCNPEVAADAARGFLDAGASFSAPRVPVLAFHLYSSAFVDRVPVYRREATFPLPGPPSSGNE